MLVPVAGGVCVEHDKGKTDRWDWGRAWVEEREQTGAGMGRGGLGRDKGEVGRAKGKQPTKISLIFIWFFLFRNTKNANSK